MELLKNWSLTQLGYKNSSHKILEVESIDVTFSDHIAIHTHTHTQRERERETETETERE